MTEEATTFDCCGTTLVGIVHRPAVPKDRGVLVVVGGGPQYRVGGHRQLVLWARRLAHQGYPVFRFDYRGMGDSHGDFEGYVRIDEDIRAALDHFSAQMPQLREFVLWGECDAASAILFYAHRDPRVCGAVLLNPWARSDAGEAKTLLRHYYINRLLQPSFWRKLAGLRFNPLDAARSWLELVRRARRANPQSRTPAAGSAAEPSGTASETGLQQRLLAGFTRFSKPVMLVMSGRDNIAREFDALANASEPWKRAMHRPSVSRLDIADADHTFSTRAWRDEVVEAGIGWLSRF